MECSESVQDNPDDDDIPWGQAKVDIRQLPVEALGNTNFHFASNNNYNVSHEVITHNTEEHIFQETSVVSENISDTISGAANRILCECPKSAKSPERSRRYLRSGMTPRANDISGSLSQKLPYGRNSTRYGGTRNQGSQRLKEFRESCSTASVSMLDNVATEIDVFSSDGSTEGKSPRQVLTGNVSKVQNRAFYQNSEAYPKEMSFGNRATVTSRFNHDAPKHAARISAAKSGHLKLNTSRNRWRSLENMKPTTTKIPVGVSNHKSVGNFHQLENHEAFEVSTGPSRLHSESISHNKNVRVLTDEDSESDYSSTSEDNQSYLADSPKRNNLAHRKLGLRIESETMLSSPNYFSEEGKSVFSYEDTDSDNEDDENYNSLMAAHAIVRPVEGSSSHDDFSHDPSSLTLTSPSDMDPFCPKLKEKETVSKPVLHLHSPMVTPRSASSVDNERDYPMPKTAASFTFSPRKMGNLTDLKAFFKNSSHVDELTNNNTKTDLAENASKARLATPPPVAKPAWSNTDSLAVTNTDILSAQSPASSRRQERRHSTNINFRTISSAIASAQRKQQHQFSKSRLPWKQQAAKARESVASLLSFNSSKSKEKGRQRPGLKDKKGSTQYYSEPTIGSSQALNEAELPSTFSTSQENITHKAQISHPEMTGISEDNHFGSNNPDLQHSSHMPIALFNSEFCENSQDLDKSIVVDTVSDRSRCVMKERAYSCSDVADDSARGKTSFQVCNDTNSYPKDLSQNVLSGDGGINRLVRSHSEEGLLTASFGFSEQSGLDLTESECTPVRHSHAISNMQINQDIPINHTPSRDLCGEDNFEDDGRNASDTFQLADTDCERVKTESHEIHLPLGVSNDEIQYEKENSLPWMSPNLRRTLKAVRNHLEKVRSADQSPETMDDDIENNSDMIVSSERNSSHFNKSSVRENNHLENTVVSYLTPELKESESTDIVSNTNEKEAETTEKENPINETHLVNDDANAQPSQEIIAVNHKHDSDEEGDRDIEKCVNGLSNQVIVSTPNESLSQLEPLYLDEPGLSNLPDYKASLKGKEPPPSLSENDVVFLESAHTSTTSDSCKAYLEEKADTSDDQRKDPRKETTKAFSAHKKDNGSDFESEERVDDQMKKSRILNADENREHCTWMIQKQKLEPKLDTILGEPSSFTNKNCGFSLYNIQGNQYTDTPQPTHEVKTDTFADNKENVLSAEHEVSRVNGYLPDISLGEHVQKLIQKSNENKQNNMSDLDRSSCSSTETLHDSPRDLSEKSQWEGFLPEIEERLLSVRKLHRSDSVSSISSGMSSISITSTRSEARGKKSSKRVDGLLSNQLFRKHLIRHADTLEKRVLRMHRKGMRKALSNFDLSKEPSEEINNYLNLGDINNNNNDDSDINNTEDESCEITPRSEHDRCNDLSPRESGLTRSMSLCEQLQDSHQLYCVDQDSHQGFQEVQCNNASEDNTLIENLPQASSEIVLDLACEDQNMEKYDYLSSKQYPRPLKKAASITAFSVATADEEVQLQPCKPTVEASVRRRFSDASKFDKPFTRHERSSQSRMHIPSFQEFRNRQKHSPVQEPEEMHEVQNQCTEHQPLNIYVIKEDETDENLNNIVTKEYTEECSPSVEAKDLTAEIIKLEQKEKASASNHDLDTTLSPRSIPVFMHPAITVTAGDVSRFKSKSPRHSFLNRSKSESNIKRRRQVSSSTLLTPQTRDRSQTFSTRPNKPVRSGKLQTLDKTSRVGSLRSDALNKTQANRDHVQFIDSDCNNMSSEGGYIKTSSKNPVVLVTDGEIVHERGLKGFSMNAKNPWDSSEDEIFEKSPKYAAKHNAFSQIPLSHKKNTRNQKIVDVPDISLSNIDLYQFKEATNLRESLGFDLDPSLQESGNLNQLTMSSWPKPFSTSKPQNGSETNADGQSVEFEGEIQQDFKQQGSAQALEGKKQKKDTNQSSKVLFYLDKDDTQTFTAGDGPNMFPLERTLHSKEHELDSVRALRLSDADISCDDPGVPDLGNKEFVRQTHVTQRTSPTNSSSDSDQSCKNVVLRSTSDVSPVLSDERERRKRDRKDRPYKSDPFTGTDRLPQHSMYLDLHKDSSVSASCSFPSLEELAEHSDSMTCLYDDDNEREPDSGARKRRNRLSNLSSTSEDSGVSGHTTEDGDLLRQKQICLHCSAYTSDGRGLGSSIHLHQSVSDSGLSTVFTCKKCDLRRRERKETIQELAETEKRYGRDLSILKEEFYRPMKSTSMLTIDQLDAIFSNLEELIHAHKQFMSKLTNVLVTAVHTEDEELSTVGIGGVFLQASSMFLAFEKYCVSQGQASLLLDQLIKEKELLRVFLQVAQNENPKLRRMHLKTFLMVPVQRVMKYPLLLSRLYKVTPYYHSDKANIKQARENIEEILEQINSKTNIPGGLRKRPYDLFGYSLSDKIEVNRVAIDALGWPKQNVCDVVTSRLWFGQLSEQSGWGARKAGGGAKNVKFSLVHAALLTHGRPTDHSCPEYPLSPRDRAPVQQVAMVLVKEKAGRFQVLKEPLLMDRCVVTADSDFENLFEVHEQGRETYLFKGERSKETKMWTKQLKSLCKNLGYWRRRRNGVPNIMLKAA